MNSGDLNKVWEIKTLKRKSNEEDARNILDRIAKQVQPIMRKHNWRVKVLSEFCPKNRCLLGLNVGRGIHVKLRLRRPDRDDEFLPYHKVLDTMLHELCHNTHGPHNANFYKLWDELRKECEDLVNKGIGGTGQGFNLPGRRVGGVHKPRHSSLGQVALTATKKRARRQSLLSSGPKRLGGDKSIMAGHSPGQAAAMAAERRLQDNIWCGSEFYDLTEEDDHTDSLPKSSNKGSCSEISSTAFNKIDTKVKSQKRKRESDDVSLAQSANMERESTFIDLTNTASKKRSTHCLDEMPHSKDYHEDLYQETSASSSQSSHGLMLESSSVTWQCARCTLLNPQLASICRLCASEKPEKNKMKNSFWSCRFCTLENDVKMDKCEACESWRYSYGPPVAACAPNFGT